VAKIGKEATALVEVEAGKVSGSAFCIHSSGLFLTNEHVVGREGTEVTLVLGSGLKTQKILKAQVVRGDGELDLALLKAEGQGKHAALSLGSMESVTELTELVALGFPFGKDLSLEKDTFPAVTVNAGTVTALRHRDGVLHRIQMDAGVNPGCSGGPVLDMSGKVIGVVVEGVEATTLNFAIPIADVSEFLSRPDIEFVAPVLERSKLCEPVLFQARALPVFPAQGTLRLELVLRVDERETKHPMKFADGVYRVTATPVSRSAAAEEIPLLSCSIVAFRDQKEVGRVSEALTIQGSLHRAFGIHPPDMPQEQVVQPLPAPVSDLAVGGGGRYLILHFPKLGKLAVFDVNQAKITQFIPVEDEIKFTAGLDKLILVSPSKLVLKRYSLHTFQQEASASLPIRGEVMAIVMGSASKGPLLIRWTPGRRPNDRTTLTFFDVEKLEPLTWRFKPLPPYSGGYFGSTYDQRNHIRAAPDGSAFGVWSRNRQPNGLETLVVLKDKIKMAFADTSAGHVMPGMQARVIYTGTGLFSNDLTKLTGPWPDNSAFLPAQEGGYYLRLPGPILPGAPETLSPPNKQAKVIAYAEQNDQLIASCSGIELPNPDSFRAIDDFTFDKRVHFIPSARLLITIPDNDRLVLHRFNLEEALAKLDPWVYSRAPLAAENGKTYRYQIRAHSPSSSVRYDLECAPPGMTISPGGLIEWKVPEHLGLADCSVLVRMRGAGSNTSEHGFRISVEGRNPLRSMTISLSQFKALSADGRWLATASSSEGGIKVWDIQTATEVAHLKSSDYIGPLMLSSDGQRLASYYREGIGFWDIKKGKESSQVQWGLENMHAPKTVSPDGKRFAAVMRISEAPTRRLTGSSPKQFEGPLPTTEIMKIWDTATGHEMKIKTIKWPVDVIGGLVFSPDGKRLAGTAGGTLKIWDAASGDELMSTKALGLLTFSPDGQRLAGLFSAKGTIEVVDSRSGKGILSFAVKGLGSYQYQYTLAYSPDGGRLVFCSGWGLFVYDALTGREICAVASPRYLASATFSPDSKLVLTPCPIAQNMCDSLRIWDAATGLEIFTLKCAEKFEKAAFIGAASNRIVTVGDDVAEVWTLTQ
jgi:WD40 repeat protein